MIRFDNDDEGKQVSVLAEIVDIPFGDPDVRVPEERFGVEIGGEIQIIFVEFELPLYENHPIFECTVKLIN